jgi:autotransporter-associated beta strand protein
VVNGGSLDLNGNSQLVGTVSNNNTVGNTGGKVTNSSGTTANFISSSGSGSSNSTYGGIIDGNLNFYKTGSNAAGTLTLTGANTYTGSTNVQGAGLILKDSGTLASLVVNVGGATLTLDNTGLSDNASRISSNALINLNSATLAYNGANYLTSTETLGATGAGVTSAQGLNTLVVTPPAAATNNRTVLTVGTLTRSTGSSVVFAGTGLGSAVPGNAQIILTNTQSLTGGILGGWATAGTTAATSDGWATLASAQSQNVVTTQGSVTVTLASGNTSQMVVGQLLTGNSNLPSGATIASITGATTFTISSNAVATGTASTNFNNSGVVALNATAYTNQTTAGSVSLTSGANYNIALAATGQVTSSTSVAVNSILINPSAASVTSTLDLASNTLTVTSGGIMRTSANTSASVIQNGTLTAGTAGVGGELFFVTNNATAANSLTVAANITDNSGGSVSVVKSGTGSAGFVLSGSNTYSGGTYINSGIASLGTAGANGTSIVAVPGNLTVNNGATVSLTAAGEISQNSNVTMNGGSTLTMSGSNTLASVTLNGNGGTVTPTVNTATSLTLGAANAITVQNDNAATTPTITGTALVLSNAAPVISVSGVSPEGLIISAPLDTTGGGTIQKTGTGSLVLSGLTANTLTGGLNIAQGTVIFDNTAVSNAYGTGAITLGNGVTIQAGTAARTISNATTVVGDFTFGGAGTTAAANNLTLSSTMTLQSGAHRITVTSPLVTDTISGQITGGTNLIKDGAGTLVVSSSANNYGGTTTVANGVLKLGASNVIPDLSALTVNSGAVFDINSFDETLGSVSGDISNTSGGMITNSGVAAHTLNVAGDNGTATFAGVITNSTGALNLVKSGSGTQTLAGANTYNGTTAVNAGKLNITGSIGATVVTVSGGAALGGIGNGTTTGTIGNVLSATGGTVTVAGGATAPTQGAIDLIDNQIGTLTILGNNTGASTTTLTLGGASAGQLSNLNFEIGSSTTDKIAVNQAVTVNAGGAVVNLTQLAGMTLMPGTYQLVTYSSDTLTGAYSQGTGFTGGPFNMSLQHTATSENLVVTANTVNALYWKGDQSSVWNTFNGTTGASNWYTDNTASTNSFAIPTSSTNVFFTVDSGATNLTTTLGADTTIASLTFTGTGTTAATNSVFINGPNTLTIGSGGINVQSGSGAHTINANVVLGSSETWLNNGSNMFTVAGNVNNGSNNLIVDGTGNTTIGGVIGSGSGSLTKNGTGTLFLTGSNTYTGATNLNGGIVQFSALNNLGLGTAINFGGGTLQYNGNTDDITTRTVTLNAGGGTIDTNGSNVTYANAIGGVGGLTKVGAGKLTLGGTNTYSGQTAINGGTLSVGASANLGDGSATNTISMNGGTLQATGTFDAGPNRSVSLGASGGTVDVTAPATLTVSGTISGATGGLTKVDGGTLALTGTDTYQGATTVSGGTLQVGVGGVGSTSASSNITATSTTFSTTTMSGVDYQNNPVTGKTYLTSAPTLTGSGTVGGSVVIGTNATNVGVLGAGDAATSGKLTINGNLTLNTGSQIQMRITTSSNFDPGFTGATSALVYLNANGGAGNGSAYSTYWKTASGNYDTISVVGNTTINAGPTGGPAVFVTSTNTSGITQGEIFKLLDWAQVGTNNSLAGTGTFNIANDLVLPTLTNPGLSYDTSAFTTYGVVVVVPEPGRVMLLLFGLLALGLRRRRREQAI